MSIKSSPQAFLSLFVGFDGDGIRQYVEKLHLLLHVVESHLEPFVPRIQDNDDPEEVVSLFHALNEVDPRALPIDVGIEPSDRCFDTLHVFREYNLEGEVDLPDVVDHVVGPSELETQPADDCTHALW